MTESYSRAMDYALRLLGFRTRTEKEMRERLKKKGFGPETLDRVICRLKELAYLDDRVYVEGYIRSKVKPAGRRKLQYELEAKGIDRELAASGLDSFFPFEREMEDAIKLLQKYLLLRQKRGSASEKLERGERQKLAARLLARGFSYETVKLAMAKLYMDVAE